MMKNWNRRSKAKQHLQPDCDSGRQPAYLPYRVRGIAQQTTTHYTMNRIYCGKVGYAEPSGTCGSFSDDGKVGSTNVGTSC